MARPLRIQYPDAWYHVMNRGRRRENIFWKKADYQAFLLLLQEAAELFHVHVTAYCLMPNISLSFTDTNPRSEYLPVYASC